MAGCTHEREQPAGLASKRACGCRQRSVQTEDVQPAPAPCRHHPHPRSAGWRSGRQCGQSARWGCRPHRPPGGLQRERVGRWSTAREDAVCGHEGGEADGRPQACKTACMLLAADWMPSPPAVPAPSPRHPWHLPAMMLRTACWVGTSTLPPRWPHFFSEDSWSSKCTAGQG